MFINKLYKNINKNRQLYMLGILLILGLPMIYIASNSHPMTSYTIYNPITITASVYGDDSSGNMRILSEDTRIYTQLRVDASVSSKDGLSSIQAELFTDVNGQPNNKLTVLPMSLGAGGSFSCIFNVGGMQYGHYWIKIFGYSLTHTEYIPNPKWSQDIIDVMIENGIPKSQWPPETIAVTKNDVDIVNPASMKVFIENPYEDAVVALTMRDMNGIDISSGSILSGGIAFNLDIITGAISSYILVIEKQGSDKIVAQTNTLSGFTFNVGNAQEDGTYVATLTYIGARGWNGGTKSVIFIVYNLDEISGVISVYVHNGLSWVLAENTLFGSIKIEISNLVGDVSGISVKFVGTSGTSEYQFAYDAANSVYDCVMDTNTLKNGEYIVTIFATRTKDGAVMSMSSFDTGMYSSDKPDTDMILIYGIIGAAIFGVIFIINKKQYIKFK